MKKLFSNKKGWVWIVWGVAAAVAGLGYLVNAFKSPPQQPNMMLIYILMGIIIFLLIKSFSR